MAHSPSTSGLYLLWRMFNPSSPPTFDITGWFCSFRWRSSALFRLNIGRGFLPHGGKVTNKLGIIDSWTDKVNILGADVSHEFISLSLEKRSRIRQHFKILVEKPSASNRHRMKMIGILESFSHIENINMTFRHQLLSNISAQANLEAFSPLRVEELPLVNRIRSLPASLILRCIKESSASGIIWRLQSLIPPG